jgi:hypothetical protein
MKFTGNPALFVNDFKHRIEHILESNGAFFDGKNTLGHSQQEKDIVFNIISPMKYGDRAGFFPDIEIII